MEGTYLEGGFHASQKMLGLSLTHRLLQILAYNSVPCKASSIKTDIAMIPVKG